MGPDSLDAAAGALVQAHTADPLAGITGTAPVLSWWWTARRRGARDSEGPQLHLLGV
ncbi:hypothetical protein [Streptomyces sp. URMC 129]|uniref:hypothetical protein n=1 Tax=Streptomyces sp. URMC 129 TaxID=3423407 RepID=UPI003F1A0D1C